MAGSVLDEPAPPRSGRLGYIEGLRGAAVGAVLLYHACLWARWPGGPAGDAIEYGRLGVDLFFVISGFCMFWPLLRRDPGRLGPLNAWQFLKRRVVRIAPPYWVALGCACLASSIMWAFGGRSWWGAQPMQSVFPSSAATTVRDVGAHALFLHGFVPAFDRSIDGAFWSLSTEWQFYVALPLLVLVGRRLGVRWAVAIAAAVPLVYLAVGRAAAAGMLNTRVGKDNVLIRLVEFGAGMFVAYVAANRWRFRAAGATTVALVCAAALFEHYGRGSAGLPIAWAAAFGALVLLCGAPTRSRTIVELPPLRWLGRVSYSAYLLHGTCYLLVATVATHLDLAGWQRACVMVLVAMPVALCAASVSYRTVEAPAQRRSHAVRGVRPEARPEFA